MRLTSFQVRTFRNVIDSTRIEVEDVTCMVGKNESGKSAVLQALHSLNPAKPPLPLDLLDEYPRWLKKEHEISGEISSAVPITAVFALSDAEMEELAEQFGVQVLSEATFTASRSYAEPDAITIEAPIAYAVFVEAFVGKLPSRLQKALGKGINTSTKLITALTDLTKHAGDEDAETASVATDATDALEQLWEITGKEGQGLRTAVDDTLRERMPRTFYFSTYAQLNGRYSLDEVFQAVQNGTEEEAVQAAADFLKIARAVPDSIEDWDYEQSNAELEAVSSLLTKRVKEHWHQNDHLKLRVSLEPEKYTNPQGQQDVRRYLQFRVEDERHDFSNRLDRRSTGFRWFISFLAAFLEFERDSNLILLLDEPGLSLHARAQMDLLTAIETKLATTRQVVYTTHSPFLVRSSRLSQVRVVEDQGPELGSAVSNDAGAVSDPDSLFPLEAALGYDIAQSLFIGRRNILVEGVSDYIYLATISGHLEQAGQAFLPADCRLIPAGGATNIPTFLALLGTQLDVVVLIDGNTSDQRIRSSIAAGRVQEARIISLDTFSSVTGADIEDLFTPEEYLALYNATFTKSLKEAELKGKDRIVKRIERKEGPFDHGVVAAHFLRNLDASLARLSDETLERFSKVIEALVAALPAD